MMTDKFLGLSANSQIASIYDGKKARAAVRRKTVDMHVTVIRELETRIWQRDERDRPFVQPDALYFSEMTTPAQLAPLEVNAICTKYVRTAANKGRCPIFCVTWTPEGRRLITGANTGEFTLWNGLTFNFETILQAHDTPVRDMKWSHDDLWMLTTDNKGLVKYWQANMNNVHTFCAHDDACRSVTFAPTDVKFATCSDDGTVRVWDMYHNYNEPERILKGHGSDVKVVDWHPEKGMLASGSKDSQQPVIMWDPRTGKPLTIIREHRNSVFDLSWNKHNGNWLATGSRDHLIKIYDIRMMKRLQDFRGHKREVCCLAWHPVHEGMLASGGWDGSLYFWSVGCEQEIGSFDTAHDSQVWSISWHPLGHILCSGSNDYTTKFWTRHRPGEDLSDMKFNRDSAAAPNKEVPAPEELEPEPMAVETGDVLPGLSTEQELDILSSQHRQPDLSKRGSYSGMEEKNRMGFIGKSAPFGSHLQKNAPIQPQHLPTVQGAPRQHIEPEPTTFRSSFPPSSEIYEGMPGTHPQNPVPGLGDSEPLPHHHLPPHMLHGQPHTPPPLPLTPLSPREYDYPPPSKRDMPETVPGPVPGPGPGQVQMGPVQGIHPPPPHSHPDNWREFDRGYDDWDYPEERPRPMPPFGPREPFPHAPIHAPLFERDPGGWGPTAPSHGPGPLAGPGPGSSHGPGPGPVEDDFYYFEEWGWQDPGSRGRGMMPGRGMPWGRGWGDDRGRRGKGLGRGKRGGR